MRLFTAILVLVGACSAAAEHDNVYNIVDYAYIEFPKKVKYRGYDDYSDRPGIHENVSVKHATLKIRLTNKNLDIKDIRAPVVVSIKSNEHVVSRFNVPRRIPLGQIFGKNIGDILGIYRGKYEEYGFSTTEAYSSVQLTNRMGVNAAFDVNDSNDWALFDQADIRMKVELPEDQNHIKIELQSDSEGITTETRQGSAKNQTWIR